MRTSAAILVLACLALLAGADHVAAQQYSCPPAYGGELTGSGFEQCLEGYYPLGCGCGVPVVWGSAEYWLGFRNGRRVPALVTTSPAGTIQEEAGVLGLPSTTILFGGGTVEDNPASGARGEIGMWLDGCAKIGIGGSFTILEEESLSYSASSDGSTILARPFYNTLLDQQASQLVAFPSLVSGTVNVQLGNEVTAAEVFVRKQIGLWPSSAPFLAVADAITARVRSLFALPGTQVVSIHEYTTAPGAPMTRLDFIIGYQHSRIDDSLLISNNLVSLDPAFLGQIGTTLDAYDRFDIRNDFHGGTLGLRSVSYYGCWSLTLLGKVALGNMHQLAAVDGQTVITVPGGPSATSDGGLLAQPSNMGEYARDQFAVIPEARVMLAYCVTPQISLGVGYDFMYWSGVGLAADQIDTQVDVTQTLPNPTFSFRDDDVFVHAVTFVVQLNH